MNRDFIQYISNRCDTLAAENPDYKKMQKELGEAEDKNDIERYSELSIQLEILVQQLCYTQGFKDAMQLMLGSKEV